MFVAGATEIADLDAAPLGFRVYGTSTANKPSGFGIVLTYSNTATAFNFRWIYQIAFGTDHAMYHRDIINNTAWTEWKKLSTQ